MIAEIIPIRRMPAHTSPVFDYEIPSALSVKRGMLVRVPFRKSEITGVVYRTKRLSREMSLSKITGLRTAEPVFDDHGFSFFEWLIKELCVHPSYAAWLIFARLPKRPRELSFAGFTRQRQAKEEKNEIFWHTFEKELIAHIETFDDTLLICPSIQRAEHIASLFKSRATALTHTTGKKEWWQMVIDTNGGIVVGTRSAIFLPRRFSRIIVVDEEHSDHKQSDMHPRYDARRIAWARARYDSVPLIVTSVAPRAATFFISQTNIAWNTHISQDDVAAPRRIVIKKGMPLFSLPVTDVISETLARNKSVVLFHGTKGFGRLVRCGACEAIAICSVCSLPLRPDAENQSRCRRCLTESSVLTCASCGSPNLRTIGVGIERLSRFAQEFFPNTPRFMVSNTEQFHLKGALLFSTQLFFSIFSESSRNEIGAIIVPHVESLLGNPSYRSVEQTITTLRRLAIIASACGVPFLTQSFRETALPVTRNEMQKWYADELRLREQLGYPPFTQLFKVIIAGDRAAVARTQRMLETEYSKDIQFLDPEIWERRASDRIAKTLFVKLPKQASSHILCKRLAAIPNVYLDRDPL